VVLEASAIVAGLDDVAVVREPVERGQGRLGIAQAGGVAVIRRRTDERSDRVTRAQLPTGTSAIPICTPRPAVPDRVPNLEHFQVRWKHLTTRKMRQNNNIERRF